MTEILLDCGQLNHRAAAHAYLAGILKFPPYYGKNLDALYDLLTDGRRLWVRFTGTEQLADYGDRVLAVFLEAAAANPHLRITVSARKR